MVALLLAVIWGVAQPVGQADGGERPFYPLPAVHEAQSVQTTAFEVRQPVDAGAITISGGAGTVLPAQDTVVTAGQRVVLDLDFAGNDLVLFTINASGASHAQWLENGDVHILAKRLGTAEPWWWANDMGETNPLAAEAVGKLAVSTEATTVPTITVAILKDSS